MKQVQEIKQKEQKIEKKMETKEKEPRKRKVIQICHCIKII